MSRIDRLRADPLLATSTLRRATAGVDHVTRTAGLLLRVFGTGGRRPRAGPSGTGWSPATVDDAPVSGTGHRPCRVALVSGHYAPRVGGLERYVGRLARALRESDDLDVVVITSAPGCRRRWDTIDGVPVLRLPTLLLASNTPVNPAWALQLPLALWRMRVDLVHAHSPVPGLADLAMLTSGRRPRLLTYHAGSMRKGVPGLTDLLLAAYERFILPLVFQRADVLVAVSPTSLAAQEPTARTIPPGVDPEFLESVPAPDRPDEGPPVLLYVGRLDRTSSWKGLDVLFDAYVDLLAEWPDLRLRLVGGGDAAPDMEVQARRRGLSGVSLPGVLHGKDLVEAYRTASLLVLPSTTDAESFGMCLIEAMACATPVVATSVGGPRWVVTPEVDGLLVPPGDRAALVAACRRLLSNRHLAQRLGAAGRDTVQRRFPWARQVDDYLSLYRSLGTVKGRPGRTTPVGRANGTV